MKTCSRCGKLVDDGAHSCKGIHSGGEPSARLQGTFTKLAETLAELWAFSAKMQTASMEYPKAFKQLDALIARAQGQCSTLAAAERPPAPTDDALPTLAGEMAAQAALGHKQFCLGVHEFNDGQQEAEWIEWSEAFKMLLAAAAPRSPQDATDTRATDDMTVNAILWPCGKGETPDETRERVTQALEDWHCHPLDAIHVWLPRATACQCGGAIRPSWEERQAIQRELDADRAADTGATPRHYDDACELCGGSGRAGGTVCIRCGGRGRTVGSGQPHREEGT